MTSEEIHVLAVREVAAIFNNGNGISYLFDQMVKLAERAIRAEKLADKLIDNNEAQWGAGR